MVQVLFGYVSAIYYPVRVESRKKHFLRFELFNENWILCNAILVFRNQSALVNPIQRFSPFYCTVYLKRLATFFNFLTTLLSSLALSGYLPEMNIITTRSLFTQLNCKLYFAKALTHRTSTVSHGVLVQIFLYLSFAFIAPHLRFGTIEGNSSRFSSRACATARTYRSNGAIILESRSKNKLK